MHSIFSAALLDPGAAMPPDLTDPQGRPAPKRFAVYRNNVVVSLTRALEDGFPTVAKLVGEIFFAAMAGAFVRAHPPTSPVLTLYGVDFADFLADFPPVARLGYLPDIARLDYGLRQSYHAADAVPADLTFVTPEALMHSRLTFAPAVRLLVSDWPVHSIWLANAKSGPKPVMRAEAVLITRPEFDPEPQLLGPGCAAVIAALQEGAPLVAALDAAPDCDPTALLTLLIQGGVIARITP